MASNSSAHRPQHRLFALLVAFAAFLVGGVVSAAPASAAGWTWYDVNADGTRETAVWYDDASRPVQAWQNTNADSGWDFVLYFDTAGAPHSVWLDTNYNSVWDTWVKLAPDGYLVGVLSNSASEHDGAWDSLLVTGTGEKYYQQCVLSCGGGFGAVGYVDTLWGMTWRDRSWDPMIVGGGLSRAGDNMLLTLAKTFELAGAMHCYNYRTTDSSRQYCRDRGYY